MLKHDVMTADHSFMIFVGAESWTWLVLSAAISDKYVIGFMLGECCDFTICQKPPEYFKTSSVQIGSNDAVHYFVGIICHCRIKCRPWMVANIHEVLQCNGYQLMTCLGEPVDPIYATWTYHIIIEPPPWIKLMTDR